LARSLRLPLAVPVGGTRDCDDRQRPLSVATATYRWNSTPGPTDPSGRSRPGLFAVPRDCSLPGAIVRERPEIT